MADYTLSAKFTGDGSSLNKAAQASEKAVQSVKGSFQGVGSVSESTSKKATAALENIKEKAQELSSKIKSVGDKFKSIGDKLTSSVTKPALAAGTALAGVTLGKGFTRLTAIDTAKVKLEALGNSAENVTDIMKSANVSVKGTSYGLDEAATTASSAVAAGIKPGQELTRYLSLTADAAATAGRTMADMGSIFNKVQTSQAAYTEELNQLADSGIPIYQWLGEEAGLSAAEVKDMAKEGQISSEMFLNAVEKNIGGAAKVVGEKSFTGALSNIWASVGRIGANFLDANGSGQGFFTQLKPLMVDFKDWLGTLEEKAATWGQVFGQAFSGIVEYARTGKAELGNFTEKAASIVTTVQPVIDVVKRIAGAFSELSPKMQAGLLGGIVAAGPLISTLGKIIKVSGSIIGVVGKLAPVLGGLCSPIGIVVAAVAALSAGFAYLMTTNSEFANYIKSSFFGIWEQIEPDLEQIGTLLKDFGGKLLPAISGVVEEIAPSIVGILQTVIPSITTLVKTLLPVVLNVVSSISRVLSTVLQSILPLMLNLTQQVMPVILGLIQQIAPVITDLLATITPVITSIIQQFMPICEEALNVVVGLIQQLAPIIGELITMLVPFIGDLVNSLMPVVTSIIGALSKIIQPISDLINKLLPPIINIIESIMQIVQALLPVVTTVIDNIIAVVTPIIDVIGELIGTIIEIITPIVTFVADIIADIVDFIAPIIQRVADIMQNVISAVKPIIEQIGNIFRQVFNVVKDIWGKIGNYITGIVDGVKGAWDGLVSFASGVWNGICDGFESMVDGIKGLINGVISGINGAIWVINCIPGVEISEIDYLMHGTDNWRGGFAYMNEGGRGELVNLPNGSQVIPHDISVHYAKEAARANNSESFEFDYDYLINGIAEAMGNVSVHHTSTMDGKVVSDTTSPLVDSNLAMAAMLERRYA